MTPQSCTRASSTGAAQVRRTLPGPALALGVAARLLPVVACAGPVLACDVCSALHEAVVRLRLVEDCCQRRVVADRLVDSFVTFLVETGAVAPEPRTSWTLRSWLRWQDLPAVQLALCDSATRRIRPLAEPALPPATERRRVPPVSGHDVAPMRRLVCRPRPTSAAGQRGQA